MRRNKNFFTNVNKPQHLAIYAIFGPHDVIKAVRDKLGAVWAATDGPGC